MRISTFGIRSCLIGVLTLSLTAAARGQEYKIKLNRPAKVGDEVSAHVTIKSKQVAEANVNGQPVSNPEEYAADLEGNVKVLAINEKTGGATKLSCTVVKFTRDDKELYPAGTVIIGEKINKVDNYTIDGVAADAANVPVLSAVLELTDPDRKLTDDDINGTDQPQKIGDAWPIKPDNLATELADQSLPVPAEFLKGESKLTDVKKVNDVDALMINLHVTADGFKATLPGATVTDGKLSVTADGVIPVDESLQGISSTSKMHLSMTVTPQNGGPVTTVTVDRETTQEQGPVKK